MSCEMSHYQLPLYFDGELDRAGSREFEQHLGNCHECQQALARLEELRGRLRDDSFRFHAPNALRQKLQDELASARTPQKQRLDTRAWMALAASWLIAVLVGGGASALWHRHQGSERQQASGQIARDLFASHWRALAAVSPVDVVSTDRHTVKPWFAGKVAESPIVDDFAAQGFPLVGGRIDYVGDTRVPTLVYRHGKHLIDVFVFPQPLPVSLPTWTTWSWASSCTCLAAFDRSRVHGRAGSHERCRGVLQAAYRRYGASSSGSSNRLEGNW